MKRVALAMLALAACADERAGQTTATSHVLVAEPTAADQSNAPADLALVGAVRRKLVLDERLSIAAKNLVVVVRDGVATIRGDVGSDAEHDAVVASIVSVPGIGRVDDRIAVKR